MKKNHIRHTFVMMHKTQILMTKKISITLCSLMITIGFAFGQEYTFKVLVNHGDNQVKKQSGELIALKTGTELFDLEEIVSADGGYIGLMHRSGKTTEVRGAGTRKVTDIAASVNTQKTSAVSRYAQFIAAKMSEGDGTEYKNRTNTVGAVSRGIGDLSVLLPDVSLEVLSDSAVVRWMTPQETEEDLEFTVTIADVFGETLYTETTNDKFINLKFNEIENESGFYIFKVFLSEDENVASEEFGIKKLASGEKPQVAQSLTSLQSQLTDDDLVNKLIFADFFEENGLLVDAITQYESALQGNEDVADIETLYKAFLIGNGIITPEEEMADE